MPATARWSTRVSFRYNSGGYVPEFAPHFALKAIARGKLRFTETVELHRVDTHPHHKSVEREPFVTRDPARTLHNWERKCSVAGNPGTLQTRIFAVTRETAITTYKVLTLSASEGAYMPCMHPPPKPCEHPYGGYNSNAVSFLRTTCQYRG